LAQFESLSFNFTSNPMHLQMIRETEDVENFKEIDAISIYEQFLSKKIKHGLLTCRQIAEGTYEFSTKRTRIYSILTKCAVAQVVDNEEVIVALDKREVLDINLSGVATVVDIKSPLFFVHQTFAEFLTAQHFMQMCFEPPPDEDLDVVEVHLDVRRLFQDEVSDQTMCFIDCSWDRYKGREINPAVLECIKEIKKSVFERICHAGMDTLYSLLQGNVFDGLQEREWMLESHKAADYDFRNTTGMGLFFHACCSSLQLAARLSKWCPMLQLDDVDKLAECLGHHNQSRPCLEMALTKVEDWRSSWPRANFFNNHLDVGDLYSSESYEFVLENCPDLNDNGLLQLINSRNFNTSCRRSIFPILLRLGADLTYEKNGIRLANMIFRDAGDLKLLQFTIKVVKHFQNSENIDSEESIILSKNVGAKSPAELGLDSSSQEGRGLYLQHIVERACTLLDSGACDAGYSLDSTDQHEYELLQIRTDDELRPISTSYKLYLMRACVADEEQEALKIFQLEEKFIPRDFKYRCGCTLVHDACFRGNLPLLEALVEKGFGLTGANNKGETPLHRSVSWRPVCTEFLLMHFLGKFYVPIGAGREDIVSRTPDEQKFVEETLGLKDGKGRTPLLSATHSTIDKSNAELLICNLLGPWLIPLKDGVFVPRTESEQREVERILGVRDADGYSPLHGAVLNKLKLRFLQLILKNLLGEYYIDCNTLPKDIKKRTLEVQQKISQLLHPRNKTGVTPLLCSARNFNKYDVHELLLRNLLGEYFVEVVDGTSVKSVYARTEEENQFVRYLIFGEDEEGRSPFSTTKGRCDEKVKLLIEANASYLLQQPSI
jgi:ankyrin repeat protein